MVDGGHGARAPLASLLTTSLRGAFATKQSISPRKGSMDCFVANAPRNDVVRSRFKQQTHVRLLAAWFARALLGTSVPSNKRDQEMPRPPSTPAPLCKIV